jgi:sigma-B regulation protein RsbU (phosphoserine phosphatase)
MALGVMPAIGYREHTAKIAPGDKLVLYSDGVTEAFSPHGELYGEERLRETLRGNTGKSAQAVLDAVLDSVHTFAQDAPQADDLTLLILKRAEAE